MTIAIDMTSLPTLVKCPRCTQFLGIVRPDGRIEFATVRIDPGRRLNLQCVACGHRFRWFAKVRA